MTADQKKLNCFKLYDIRGKLKDEIDENVAYRIGRATAQNLNAKNVVLGYDARATSPTLAEAIAVGISDAGANVLKLGLSGTEEMYWAVKNLSADAGIEVTASHNPIDYNGMKIVKSGSEPLTQKEFVDIRKLAEQNKFTKNDKLGLVFDKKFESQKAYIDKIIDFIDTSKLKPHKIVINSGNGAAGPAIDALESELEARSVETNFLKVSHEPDPLFPNGIPNPLLKENRSATADVVQKENADFGVAFDGDFDRCFLFDNFGNFVSSEYVVGILAEIFLRKNAGATIVHDPRVIWNTRDIVKSFGGKVLTSRTGHAFVKASMRNSDAVYGGEVSAHHYFKEFAYCDSGMIPWLLVWELLSVENIALADLIAKRKASFPSSGEINFKVPNPDTCLRFVKNKLFNTAQKYDEFDGLSMRFQNWRFNLRKSNTEPLVRLNIETIADEKLLNAKMQELESYINQP